MNDLTDKDWVVKQNNDLCTVWLRDRGIPQFPDIPIGRADFILPKVKDINIVKLALLNFRTEWDGANYEVIEELK